jgi:putative N6-adenine-specific DNA methylase
MQSEYFATTALGLEDILAGELRALGIAVAESTKAGVLFGGTMEDCMRANLHLRTANRIVLPLREFECPSPEVLYAGVADIDWRPFFPGEHTLAVSASVRDSEMTHSLYAALTTKDSICDTLRESTGKRPNVDRVRPDVQVVVRISKNRAIIGVDTSGESLHQRGYRRASLEAPLKETLAAGLVLATGWNGHDDFYDPMCGSGTIAIEAALIARRIPPNFARDRFGFMRLPGYDRKVWERVRDEARAGFVPGDCLIEASDEDEHAIAAARINASSAHVDSLIRFFQRDIKDLPKVRRLSILVANPPYGTRMGEVKPLRTLYRTMGEVFRKRLRGSAAWVFTGNAGLARYIPLKPSVRKTLYNGAIQCKLLKFDIE